ncbi:MAG: hypothetical protein P4L40_18605 [Terracidiphilus sp.]|nr:hypothetical protein [Terracidiphilus sp.]
MIYLGFWRSGLLGSGETGALNQRSATGRTPIALGFLGNNCVTLAANTFHR